MNTPGPLVSILIPVFNCESYIEECINSILNQTYSNLEILMLDDGSKDHTWNVMKSFDDTRIHMFRFMKNRGNVVALNHLIKYAGGKYIALQDADDWSARDRIQKQVSFLEEKKAIALCGTSYQYFASPDNFEDPVTLPVDKDSILDFIELTGNPSVCCGSMVFRKSIYKEIGFFREYFNRIGAADFDWYYRVLEKYEVANINEPLYFYRRNPYSITNTLTSDPRKQYSMAIANLLYKERKRLGYDPLESKDFSGINKLLSEKTVRYQRDRSLIHREIAISSVRKGLFRKSLFNILVAILKNPAQIENIKTLRYWFWKFNKR